MEFIFELIFGPIIEISLELFFTLYIKLMTLIVPEHKFSKKLHERTKTTVTVFAVILFICVPVGFFMFVIPPSSHPIKILGGIMLFGSLVIIAAQVVAGIILKHTKDNKK